jgi:hypothetical protein
MCLLLLRQINNNQPMNIRFLLLKGVLTAVFSCFTTVSVKAQINSQFTAGKVRDIHPQGWLKTMMQRQRDGRVPAGRRHRHQPRDLQRRGLHMDAEPLSERDGRGRVGRQD